MTEEWELIEGDETDIIECGARGCGAPLAPSDVNAFGICRYCGGWSEIAVYLNTLLLCPEHDFVFGGSWEPKLSETLTICSGDELTIYQGSKVLRRYRAT